MYEWPFVQTPVASQYPTGMERFIQGIGSIRRGRGLWHLNNLVERQRLACIGASPFDFELQLSDPGLAVQELPDQETLCHGVRERDSALCDALRVELRVKGQKT